MPARPFPSQPDLNHLKYQARDLLKGHAARDRGVAQLIREFNPRYRAATDEEIFAAQFKLGDAQFMIAREYGFKSWTRLKVHVESPELASRLKLPHHQRIDDAVFRRAVDLIDSGDAVGLRAHLEQHPKLVRQHVEFESGNYFHDPTLLEFIAENPIRHGKLPPNIVDVARVILDAAPDHAAPDQQSRDTTLALVATGSVPHACGVQRALIDVLCAYGADPGSAVHAAALHGYFETVEALLAHGARIDLPIAAVLNRVEEARKLLPAANSAERHLALAAASQVGHIEIVRLLLDAGEDPNRYNPPGGHAHTTPLHQAALIGHEALVRLFLERGARADVKDLLWRGTPADWAKHEGRTEVEAILRKAELQS